MRGRRSSVDIVDDVPSGDDDDDMVVVVIGGCGSCALAAGYGRELSDVW